jgi:predicted aldo/keto reductase-like oxidoreductase
LNAASWTKVRDLDLIKWAEEKMAKGFFSYLGFSFHLMILKYFKEIYRSYDNWTLAQVPYNYVDVNIRQEFRGVKYAASKNLAVVVMETDPRRMISKKPPESIARIWQTAPVYRTQAEWALLWVWNHPEVSVALSGMSTMEQVIENIAVADRSGAGILSFGRLDLLDRVRKGYQGLNPVPCTKCRY